MNSELIALTFKGLRRRWREVARVIAVVMISFMLQEFCYIREI